MGDLHGNAIKLLYILIRHGIAQNLSVADYNSLVNIYCKDAELLTRDDLNLFDNLLEKIVFNPAATLRLIGDELADRGNNDYFTLKILEKLHQHHVQIEILLSNHGAEFIEAYEKQNDFRAPMLIGAHANSLTNLQVLIDRDLIHAQDIRTIAQQVYKPALKAISYTLDQDNNRITIYSHAPIGLRAIKKIAKKLQVRFKADKALHLAQTIEHINTEFQKQVQTNRVHQLYNRKVMRQAYQRQDVRRFPFEFLMWNRNYERLQRPRKWANYELFFVHGHDSFGKTLGNTCNLDNKLGKGKNNVGIYTVLYSHEYQLKNLSCIQDLSVKCQNVDSVQKLWENSSSLSEYAKGILKGANKKNLFFQRPSERCSANPPLNDDNNKQDLCRFGLQEVEW